MIGYLDPSSAAVGYVGAVAINLAFGGSYTDFTPAINYFKKLRANQPIVPKQTAYARVLSGEIPILLDYDFDAYRAKYTDKAPVEFVIPQEGSVSFPYVMTLLANAPHLANGKKLLDFTLSDEGQKLWAAAYLRPARPVRCRPRSKRASCLRAITPAPSRLIWRHWRRRRRGSPPATWLNCPECLSAVLAKQQGWQGCSCQPRWYFLPSSSCRSAPCCMSARKAPTASAAFGWR